MRKRIAVIIFMTLGMLLSLNAIVTRDDAKAQILNQIMVNSIVSHNETIITPYSSSWVTFIDDNPVFGWKHPCRYVFIDASSGSHQVLSATIHPENMPLFEMISNYLLPTISEIELPPIQNTTPERNRDPHLYAIMINGTNLYNKEIRFWNNLSAMYCALKDLGYEDSKIYVHSADGTAANNYDGMERGLDLDKRLPINNDIRFPATLPSIK